MFEGRYSQGAVFISVLLIFLFFSSCKTQKKAEVTSRDFDLYIQNVKEADSLYSAGSYTCLKDAYDIYEELLAIPFEWEATSEKLFKTALLLSLRVKELGIVDNTFLRRAEELIDTYSHLVKFERYMKFASCIPYSIKGIAGGFLDIRPNLNEYYDWLKQNIKPLDEELKVKAKTTEFCAYMYISVTRNPILSAKSMSGTRNIGIILGFDCIESRSENESTGTQ